MSFGKVIKVSFGKTSGYPGRLVLSLALGVEFVIFIPFVKLSVRQIVRWTKYPFSKLTIGKMSFGKVTKVTFGKTSGYPADWYYR